MLETNLVNYLKEHNLTISFAESCTAGLLSATLVNVSGASAVFKGSFVTYSNEMKNKLVKVPCKTLKKYGAISEETVCAMAEGAAQKCNADVALAVSGNAGPDALEGKKVGIVCMAVYYNGQCDSRTFYFRGDRELIRHSCIDAGYSYVLEVLEGAGNDKD